MRLLTIFAAGAMLVAGSALADDKLDGEAHTAVMAFLEAVAAGPDAVEKILAPEYQIMRSNGIGYDRAGYIASVGGVNLTDFSAEKIVATADGDVMVTRYFLKDTETIDGVATENDAPRLTVFRKIDGAWKVAAHANFAPFAVSK